MCGHGLSDADIALLLNLPVNGARAHVTAICGKIGADNRVDN